MRDKCISAEYTSVASLVFRSRELESAKKELPETSASRSRALAAE